MGACLALGSLASCVSKQFIVKVLSPVCVCYCRSSTSRLFYALVVKDFPMTTRATGCFADVFSSQKLQKLNLEWVNFV